MPTYREQSSPPDAPPPPEVRIVRSKRIACEGVGGALGHPRVYLEMGEANFVECGYCDRRFELAPDADGWVVRDLGSLNGTHVNGETIRGDRPLRPLDELRVGQTKFVFVDELGQLPDVPKAPAEKSDGLEIRKRLGQTRYQPLAVESDEDTRHESRVAPPQAVPVLYRLALDMAAAGNPAHVVGSGDVARQ